MATRPDAARGKTTRKGKIKKIIKGVMTDFAPGKSIKVEAKGMSPGAMGGRTERQLPTPPRLRSGTPMPTLSKAIFDELNTLKTKADKAATKLFADGGEVMDLTTEVEVE